MFQNEILKTSNFDTDNKKVKYVENGGFFSSCILVIFVINEHGLELAGKKRNYFYHLDWIFINVELKGQFCDGVTFFL